MNFCPYVLKTASSSIVYSSAKLCEYHSIRIAPGIIFAPTYANIIKSLSP